MFVLQKSVPLHGVDALTADLGFAGQIALDDATGDRYAKIGAAWVKVADGAGNPVAPPLSGQITLKNSSGTVSRTLTATNGVATLAATDALVTNGSLIAVQNSAGADPHNATMSVTNGALTGAKLASTVALVDNGDTLTLQKSDGTTSAGNAGLNSPATAAVANGVVTAIKAAA
ncbi:hypothetical protein [Burkholderia multivorans]|uniref:hypothetical protein n=1 Tax=Burkholderia multivorans TaxID=87883 RepID=UPI0015902A14|nr:hypothetical protein [Burkholderia multivorans]MCA8339856.1 hypothetical protein [Burkholderia multivorans]